VPVTSVVCWLWNDGSREYRPEHVNVLQRMVARHLTQEHRFICITDEPREKFSEAVEVIKTPAAAARAGRHQSPEGQRFPSCYRRLWTFSDEARVLGDRVLMIDVDLVVVRGLDSVLEYAHDFVGWRPFRDWGTRLRFGGGIYLLRTGTRTDVWTHFDGESSIRKARSKGFRGSDQAWISFCLGEKEPYWPRDSGLYSIRDMKGTEEKLPNDARLVQFNGPTKPWRSQLRWAKEHWR
jgi:hypothetical protein